MSIAEKLTTIAENTPKVYEKGYEDGKNSVVQIERYLKTATFTSPNIFGKAEVELNLDNATNLASLFHIGMSNSEDVNTTIEHLTINCPNLVTSLYCMVCSSNVTEKTYKHITLNVDTSGANHFLGAFRGCQALEIIDGTPLNFSAIENSTKISNIFYTCKNLIEFRVVANTVKYSWDVSPCPNLSTATIQSIIDGLADLTDSDTQTLTVHADVYEKIITNGWDALITAKNWILVST